jgi:hypothetical protein
MNSHIMKKQQKHGQHIMNMLDRTSDAGLKLLLDNMLRDTFGDTDKKYADIFDKGSTVTRLTKNQQVKKITISSYASIYVDWSGVNYAPEHGSSECIVSFTAFAALQEFLTAE